MKFSLSYVKQNPVMFGAIFVVFGVLLYLVMNKGAGGTTQYVTTGPSEALQAAQLQSGTAIQAAQIQAGASLQEKQLDAAVAGQTLQAQLAAITAQINGQETLANMNLQYQFAELAANSALGSKQIDASLLALQAQLDNQLDVVNSNNQFMVDYAKVAADNATAQVMINANLQATLGEQSAGVAKALSHDQMEAYKFGSAMNAVSTLDYRSRTNGMAAAIAMLSDKPTTVQLGGGNQIYGVATA